MRPHTERRLLQLVILLAAIVPVSAGAWGAAGGLHLSASGADSQVRYLSGLLLGIGLCFWAFTPTIERRGAEVRVLALIVVIGGLARLFGVVTTGAAHTVSVGPLAMELGVTPLLALWRERVERRLRPQSPIPAHPGPRARPKTGPRTGYVRDPGQVGADPK